MACGAVVAMLGLAAPLAVSPTAQAAEVAGVTCTNVSIPVDIGEGPEPIVGRLCVPDGAKVVQLLVHGITWDQYYWDFPYQPEKYSYARAANAAGYATLNISRLGHGGSAHPPSGDITLQSNANSVHQVVQALRRGDLGAQFTKVVLVGHSIGTLISWLEAGTYQDVDGVVATAATHQANLAGLAVDTLRYYPAPLDPKFVGSGLDVGYLTTLPGTRSSYYDTSNTDPEVIALDEQLKETGTEAERITALPDILFSESKNINVPVLDVVGDQEPEFCNGLLSANCSSNATLAAGERPFYGPNATVDGLVVPNANHNIALHLNAPQTNNSIMSWLNQHIGTA
jgi:pimeloyl-ACP methyl ester carboxylesterase